MKRTHGHRVVREHRYRMPARASDLFQLLCPVREYDWIEYWACEMVYSRSGIAENNCVFKTAFHDEEAIWTVSRYDAQRHVIEFVIVYPGSRVEKLDLAVEPRGEQACEVVWTRTFTSLDAAEREEIERRSGDALDQRMALVNRMLEYYVRTGERMKGASPPAT